jgi:hypothetical protein
MYGSLTAPKRNPPILLIPCEVEEAAQAARAAKKYLTFPSKLNTVFRVNDEDYKKYFVSPSMDEDIDDMLDKTSPEKLWQFSYFWERKTLALDRRMRTITRVSAFQLAILNALLVDLQPGEDSSGSSDFALAASKLLVDMSMQVMTESVRASHYLSQLRRNNVCAGLKGEVSSMTKELLALPYDSDSTQLFAGQFHKVLKSVAKKKDRFKQVRDFSANTSSRGGRAPPGNFRQRAPSVQPAAQTSHIQPAAHGSGYQPYNRSRARDNFRRNFRPYGRAASYRGVKRKAPEAPTRPYWRGGGRPRGRPQQRF